MQFPPKRSWTASGGTAEKSKEARQGREDRELQSAWEGALMNENESLGLGKPLNAIVLGYTEKELDCSQQWLLCSWGRRERPF